MPTIITHAIVGTGAAFGFGPRRLPRSFWLLSIILPALPDADVISFVFGIHYDHFFGHRGFFHSIPFAFLLALIIMTVFLRNERFFSGRWLGLLTYFFMLTASHGLMDAMTDGGEGIALLAPFDNTRYFLPVRPISVSPIGIRAFFSHWGVRVLLSEALWVWLPVGLIVGCMKLTARLASPKR